MHDVGADFHFPEDFRERKGRGAGEPQRPVAGSEQQRPSGQDETAMQLDRPAYVSRVGLSEVGEYLIVDRVELTPELLELLRGEARERAHDVLGDPVAARAVSLCY